MIVRFNVSFNAKSGHEIVIYYARKSVMQFESSENRRVICSKSVTRIINSYYHNVIYFEEAHENDIEIRRIAFFRRLITYTRRDTEAQ